MDSDDERAYEPIDERADLTQDVGIEVTWNPIDSNVPETRLMKARSATSRIPVLSDQMQGIWGRSSPSITRTLKRRSLGSSTM